MMRSTAPSTAPGSPLSAQLVEANRPDALAAMRAMRHPLADDLVALVEHALDSRGLERIRYGIRLAIGALPIKRGTPALVHRRIVRKGPAAYGLAQIPDIETVRSVCREVEHERQMWAVRNSPTISCCERS